MTIVVRVERIAGMTPTFSRSSFPRASTSATRILIR